MNLTVNGNVMTPQIQNDPLLTIDQAEDIAILLGSTLNVLADHGVEVPVNETQALIERAEYYSQNPVGGMETLKAALRLAKAASKSEELDEWLAKILEKLSNDQLSLWEGIGSGISLPKAIQHEREAQD